MEHTASGVNHMARLGSNLSLLTSIFACLVLWGGITLLMTHPPLPQAVSSVDDPVLPRPVAEWKEASQTRRSLVNALLFWLPIGLGAVACGSGFITLACSREQDPESSRRALIALFLSAIPGCMCTLWTLAFSVLQILE